MEHNYHTMDTLINMEHFQRNIRYPLWRIRNEKTKKRHEQIGTSHQVQNAYYKMNLNYHHVSMTTKN